MNPAVAISIPTWLWFLPHDQPASNVVGTQQPAVRAGFDAGAFDPVIAISHHSCRGRAIAFDSHRALVAFSLPVATRLSSGSPSCVGEATIQASCDIDHRKRRRRTLDSLPEFQSPDGGLP